VLLLDLRAHQEEWVRAKLGDRRLGSTTTSCGGMLVVAGLASRDKAGAGAGRPAPPSPS
jgi:hypothetical protein